MNNISKRTLIRTALQLLSLINLILAVCEVSPLPIGDDQLTLLISTAWTIGQSAWGFWKNNSFTKAAIEADGTMEKLKKRRYR